MGEGIQPVLYWDTTLLMHTLIDGVLLYLTGKLCLFHSSRWRLLLSALMGGFYGTYCMTHLASALTSPGVRLVFPILLLQIAFAPAHRKDWMNALAVFFLLNIITTGLIFFLFFTQIPLAKLHNVIVWAGGLGLLFGIVRQLLRAVPKLSHKITAVMVEIYIEQQKIQCQGFVDTGNSLLDPVDHKPVIVLKQQLFQPLFNVAEMDWHKGPWEENEQLKKRIRVIPYCSVGKNHGMMVGFRSDRVIVKNALATTQHQDIVVALTDEKIPNCLVPAALL